MTTANTKNQLTPDEVAITQMALTALIEDITYASMDITIPLTPQARKETADILATAKSALAKIADASGHLVQLDPCKEGDEEPFLTKKS